MNPLFDRALKALADSTNTVFPDFKIVGTSGYGVLCVWRRVKSGLQVQAIKNPSHLSGDALVADLFLPRSVELNAGARTIAEVSGRFGLHGLVVVRLGDGRGVGYTEEPPAELAEYLLRLPCSGGAVYTAGVPS